MLVVTTNNIEGRKISTYYGIVSGEAIMGANIFKDFMAGIRDIVGGRSATYERELRVAKEMAMNEMILQAQERGANAIVAVDIDYETISGQGSNMLMVTCAGTAVKIDESY